MIKTVAVCAILVLGGLTGLARAQDSDEPVYDSDYRAGETSLIIDNDNSESSSANDTNSNVTVPEAPEGQPQSDGYDVTE